MSLSPDSTRVSLAASLASLAVSAPLAQGCLDAGGGDSPGLVLTRMSVDFAWAVTAVTRRGASLDIGLLGLPLNAGLAVLHTRLADNAARIRFEIQQTPADPAISSQGAQHA